jgi:hypothetical protein
MVRDQAKIVDSHGRTVKVIDKAVHLELLLIDVV